MEKSNPRSFLQKLGIGSLIPGVLPSTLYSKSPEKEKKAEPSAGKEPIPNPKRQYNGVYTGEHLSRVAFPIGGMGAGMFCLEGTGAISHMSIRHAFRCGLKNPLHRLPDRGLYLFPFYGCRIRYGKPAGGAAVAGCGVWSHSGGEGGGGWEGGQLGRRVKCAKPAPGRVQGFLGSRFVLSFPASVQINLPGIFLFLIFNRNSKPPG